MYSHVHGMTGSMTSTRGAEPGSQADVMQRETTTSELQGVATRVLIRWLGACMHGCIHVWGPNHMHQSTASAPAQLPDSDMVDRYVPVGRGRQTRRSRPMQQHSRPSPGGTPLGIFEFGSYVFENRGF